MTPPPPGDIAEVRRPATPNTALAAPAGFPLQPDIVTRAYDVTPERLLLTAQAAMAARSRVTALASDPARRRVDYVERSRVFGFPDIVLLQALPRPGGQSGLAIYSYSLQGSYDFGVNRSRVQAIVAAVDALLPPVPR